MDSSANNAFLRSKVIDQVIIKTNKTIMVRERFCDELVNERLFECGIPNCNMYSNVPMNPAPEA